MRAANGMTALNLRGTRRRRQHTDLRSSILPPGITSTLCWRPNCSAGVKRFAPFRVSGSKRLRAAGDRRYRHLREGKRRARQAGAGHYQMYFGGSGMACGALALKGPAVPAARANRRLRGGTGYQDSGAKKVFCRCAFRSSRILSSSCCGLSSK